ncbi:MAG: hypothetical protein IT320_09735 [Anaerolineae bacterium]|nr:hypothetical protein [Anaerolineae bacterium]
MLAKRLVALLLTLVSALTLAAVALGQTLPDSGQLAYTIYDGRFSRVYNLLADVSRDIHYRIRLPNRTHQLVGWLDDRRALFRAAGTYAMLDIGGATRAVALPAGCDLEIPVISSGTALACRTIDHNILVFDENCLLTDCAPHPLHLPRAHLLTGAITLAANGEQIALEMEHDAAHRLVIVDVRRDEVTHIIPYEGRDEPHPAWSPDARKLAFFDVTRSGVSLIVYDLNSSTVQIRRDMEGFAPVSPPTWSPDSARVAFYQIDSYGADIYALDVGDGALTRLAGGNGLFVGPAWSPSGGQIAFYTNAVNGGGLLVLDMFNQHLYRVGTTSVFTGGGYAWRPCASAGC